MWQFLLDCFAWKIQHLCTYWKDKMKEGAPSSYRRVVIKVSIPNATFIFRSMVGHKYFHASLIFH